MPVQTITTSDTFEASFYLTKGATILDATLIDENNKKICTFTLSGNELAKHQIDYFNCNAIVNLWDFRRCLTRINSLLGSVKANEKKNASKKPQHNSDVLDKEACR